MRNPAIPPDFAVRRSILHRSLLIILAMGLLMQAPARTLARQMPPLTNDALLTQIQQRAFQFFWQKTDPASGLTSDRARNLGADDTYNVASIASTGYMLTALPIGVQNGWVSRQEAYSRARTTLNFLQHSMPHPHGWFYHFVDKHSGQRVWNSEVSSIDTALLMAGALTCGQYFSGTAVQTAANALYSQMDWQWMLTNGGAQPEKLLLSHGWTPEKGFLPYNWDTYSELMVLLLLGLGAPNHPLPAKVWKAWTRCPVSYHGVQTLSGGPIFIYQMAQNYYDFQHQRDVCGCDYWQIAAAGTIINRQFCLDNPGRRKTYGPNCWGLNASDGPKGYRAYGAPGGPEDGTVSPTGAVASICFTPADSIAAAQAMYSTYGSRIWGRFGFSDAFNADADWYGPDVIGIDLGMAMTAIENRRTGHVWRWLASHPSTKRAFASAGFAAAVQRAGAAAPRKGAAATPSPQAGPMSGAEKRVRRGGQAGHASHYAARAGKHPPRQ